MIEKSQSLNTSVVGILFPHQLFEKHSLLQSCEKIYLVEEYLFFRQFNFHKVKIAYHRASMQAFFQKLKALKINVRYIDSTESISDIRKLLPWLAENNEKQVEIINPTDFWLEKRLREGAAQHGIRLKEYENALFLNEREDLKHFFKPEKKSFFQTTFYKQERIKRNILLEDEDKPSGGKWTFDTENRKKYPKNAVPPAVHPPENNALWKEALEYTRNTFPDNLGKLPKEPLYPFTQESAAVWLEQFLSQRFEQFGDYEDAIVGQELILHHSLLTPMLNTGLISPQEILQKSLQYALKNNVPLNSTEGFVRQIIGWREFMRGMYECKGVYARNKNFWGFEREIPNSFYDGTTGIPPIDKTIKKILQTGYCHHIERLMVLGNFMLLCEFKPDAVYRWFMELFIDAYDWVMVPNVYGMSQFADGGTLSTKPYISGSNYLMKMSNYEKGDWQKYWDGLFWRFLDKHRSFFLQNPRLSMLVRTFDKMKPEKQQEHLKNARLFLDKL